MEKATFVYASLIPSDSLTHQGTRSSIQKYLDDGYYVKESRNGFWVLVRSSAVLVTLKNSTGQQEFSMKSDILDYYGKQRMTSNLFNRFEQDASCGKIKFYMEDGCYSLE